MTTALDNLKEVYEPRIKKLLDDVVCDAKERGWTCDGPHDLTDEEYRWSLLIYMGERDDGADVSIAIAESAVHDGIPGGINFALDVTGYGGQIIGGCIPYNYTDRVWVKVDDEGEVAARWKVFIEQFDPCAIVDEIAEHLRKKS